MNYSSIKHDVVPLFSSGETLQNFINEHTIHLENVQRNKKRKREKLHDVSLIQTRCQNLSMSKINHR
jgi:hypothetical protein